MNHEPIVDRRIGGHDDCAARDGVTVARFDLSRLSSGEFCRVRPGEDAPAIAHNRSRQGIQILEGMKLGLPPEPQCPAGIE